MSNIRSISAKEITSAVKAAVAKSKTLKGVTGEGASVATIHPPILGFVLRDADLRNAAVGELHQLASDVAKALPGAHGAQAAAFLHNGHILIGFVAEPTVTLLKE
jgi:hypothetical protein